MCQLDNAALVAFLALNLIESAATICRDRSWRLVFLGVTAGAPLTKALTVTADYQLITNPAYNADRGPVHVFSGRFHGEF